MYLLSSVRPQVLDAGLLLDDVPWTCLITQLSRLRDNAHLSSTMKHDRGLVEFAILLAASTDTSK